MSGPTLRQMRTGETERHISGIRPPRHRGARDGSTGKKRASRGCRGCVLECHTCRHAEDSTGYAEVLVSLAIASALRRVMAGRHAGESDRARAARQAHSPLHEDGSTGAFWCFW